MSSIVVKDAKHNNSLVWFRNDLRVDDHNGLKSAIENSNKVIGFFCFNPQYYKENNLGFKKVDVFRLKFLIETIENLKQNLKKNNITLIIKVGNPIEELIKIISEKKINNIYLQKEWTRDEIDEENCLRKKCTNVVFYNTYDQFLYHPKDVDGEFISDIFTSFRKYCEKKVDVRHISYLSKKLGTKNLLNDSYHTPSLHQLGFENFDIDDRSAFPFLGGSDSAKERLNYYLWRTKKISYYKHTRNGLIGLDYSSKFSAWLSNGSISPREIYWEIKEYERDIMKNQSTYWLIFELIWRDFFKYISLKYGNKIFMIGGILDKNYLWKNDIKLFNDWINGKTTEQFVNANMIELKQTGWMSNRGRQNVASFLAKDLKIDWRWGAKYFESKLIDYDVHSNYGNWMYVSGVGNDPRDRKFNIKFQAERYDSENKYQKMWLQTKLF